MAGIKVKKGDTVVVISGNYKDTKGKVLDVNLKNKTVIIEKVAMVTKHQKPRGARQKGGLIKQEAAIDVSNVMVICDKCNKPTRIGINITGEGEAKSKSRMCKKCGSNIKTKAFKED